MPTELQIALGVLGALCSLGSLGAIFVWKGKLDKTVEFFTLGFAKMEKQLDEATNDHNKQHIENLERFHEIELQLARISGPKE